MKNIFLLLLLFLSVNAFAQSNWKEFESTEGKFRVYVPGEMEQKEQLMETAVGTLLYTTYFHQPKGDNPDNVFYSVSYIDYPDQSIHSDSTEFLESFFHYTIDTSVKTVTGDLRYVDFIKLDGYPGRLWRVDYKKGTATIKTRAYMVGTRFYQIQVVMQRDKSLNKGQDRFFDSFDFTE
ncbi:MAG: hypothetical protein AB8F74_23385 [Saprospiraceae bacterium]